MRLTAAGAAVDVEIIVHRPVPSGALVEAAHARWRVLRPAVCPVISLTDCVSWHGIRPKSRTSSYIQGAYQRRR